MLSIRLTRFLPQLRPRLMGTIEMTNGVLPRAKNVLQNSAATGKPVPAVSATHVVSHILLGSPKQNRPAPLLFPQGTHAYETLPLRTSVEGTILLSDYPSVIRARLVKL